MKQLVLTLLVLCLHAAICYSQPVISFQNITTGLTQPVDVANAKDGSNRLFIVEKPGTIRIWNGTSLLGTPFLDITSIVRSVGSEQGLLSVAFHPNYTANGYFYVWYNNLAGNVTLARYSRSTLNSADASSGVVMLTVYKPFTNHNGADLNFGPDGYLYFATGDGGSGGDPGNRAQNGDSLHGKMIRIDVNNPNPPYYSIPPTNPFINNPNVRDEIIAVGLRNPWRWSFDRQTGDMWIADVGQNAWEEVNFRQAGSQIGLNYRWPCMEANHEYKSDCGATGIGTNVDPIFEYDRNTATGGRSITGGFVYRGSQYPFLQGYYFASDYVTDHGWLIKSNGSGGWNVSFQSAWAADITSYGEAENGDIYAVAPGAGTAGAGILYKLTASDALPIHLVSFKGQQNGDMHQLNWQVQNEEKGDQYIVEQKLNANEPFTEINKLVATSNTTSNSYSIITRAAGTNTFYRLKVVGIDGRIYYSSTIPLHSHSIKPLVKAVVTGSTLQLTLPAGAKSVALYDAAGKQVLQKIVTANNVQEPIALQNVSRGIITIKVQLKSSIETLRVLY